MSPLGRLFYRLYKLRLGSGIVIILPIVLAVFWYAWAAFAQLDRYRRATKDPPPASLADYQLALHDELARDLRRFFLDARPLDSRLPVFELALEPKDLDALESTRKEPGEEATYVEGHLKVGKEVHEVRLRLRGGQHWHWIGGQKSLKVRLDRGGLIHGTRVFNLLNDVTPFGFEDHIILELAREHGLLAPEYFPVWVRLNNTDLGVYRYEAQPDEGLLRRSRRMPGSMYSGDSEAMAPDGQNGGLFWDAAGWSKVAWRSSAEKEDHRELGRFLRAVTLATHEEFAAYAEEQIDLERYALFDALDVVFGGNDHDYFSNHKFYVDPYRGKLEPVAWSFRAFQHEPRLNLVDHPLLVRLKMTPGYLTARNRAVYDLLIGAAAAPAIRARADALFATLMPDLEADPYWDAYKLLPRVTRFHRFMVRPMSKSKWLLAAQAELYGFSRRSRYLLDRLERPGLRGAAVSHGESAEVSLEVFADASYVLREITVLARHGCQGSYTVTAQDGRGTEVAHGELGEGAPVVTRNELAAGVRLVARPDPKPKHGTVLTEVEPRTYRYTVSSAACAPSSVELELDNVTTGASHRLALRAIAGQQLPPPSAEAPPGTASRALRLIPGEVSPHAWELAPEPPPRQLVLGPGVVDFKASRVFAAQEQVRVAPGTTLRLGPEVALVFHGKVVFAGQRSRPIRVLRLDPTAAHGGIVVQGAAAAGSRLRHVTLRDGTHASIGATEYTGVLSLHDTRDIALDEVSIFGVTDADEALHSVYVDDLRLRELRIGRVPVDAVDLEFTTAEVRGLRIAGAGDDCLDLMGTRLELSDSLLLTCANNAISAGEESAVTGHGVLISDSNIGVLAKNASTARLSRSLVYHTKTALKTNHQERHYDGKSSIAAQDLFVVECSKAADAAKGTRIDPGFVQTTFVGSGLEHLRHHVLQLDGWDGLSHHLGAITTAGDVP